MSEPFTLRQVDIVQDAAKLAEMWRESDDQWPGTWSRGVDLTPELVTEWHERERLINEFVMETDDAKIVAYCSFNQLEEQKDAGYVALLNVQPSHQGKSLGRRLLQRCLERCSELGFNLLTLGTWSGNLKSVPLYKKTGFFWVPDTSVWMLNFIPAILKLPCAQPYFQKHDWYRTFKRALKQQEDDERWEGMKVFTYHWQEGDEQLTVWADRESRTLTAVETDAFFAGATVDNIEPAKGMSTTIRWRLTNKQDRAMAISLIASGTEHIKLEHRAALVLAPGETARLEATVQLAPDTPDAKRFRPMPALRSLLIVDGELLELGTGVQPRPAVAVETAPQHVTLLPGAEKVVQLQLRSYLPKDVTATVSLAPTPGLVTGWTEQEIAIPARSFAALPVTLSAARGGVYPLSATVYLPDGKTVPEPLPIFALPPGGVLGYHGAKESRMENEWTRLILQPRAGEVRFTARQPNVTLGNLTERIGPPYWPSELDEKWYDIALEKDGGRITAILTADLETYPELTLIRKVALGGGPLVEIEHTLVNKSTTAYRFQVDRSIGAWHRDRATLTVPLKGGIVQSRMSEFPAGEADIGKKPDSLAERWAAVTSQWGTLGLLWENADKADPPADENEFGWGIHLPTVKLDCRPQAWTRAGKLYVYVGPGGWKAVRDHARRLSGTDDEPEIILPLPRKVYDARLEPSPLITLDDQVDAVLTIDNLRAQALQGTAVLHLPEPLRAPGAPIELADVTVKRPLNTPVTLHVPQGAAAYAGHVDLRTRLFDAQIPVGLVRLGDRTPVSVSFDRTNGSERVDVDNGRTRFSIAPGFTGALTRWEEAGVNHVLSPYPEQKTLSWMSPWFGGITPIVIKPDDEDFPGKLYQETLSAQAIRETDDRGIEWSGVRVSGELEREDFVGLGVEFDYLTVGKSNVLKLVCHVHNHTTAQRHATIGWLTFWQLDGASTGNTLRSQEVERKHTPWDSWPVADHWGTLYNPQTGRTAAIISAYPHVRMIDWGAVGGHLGWYAGVDLKPARTTTRACYVVLCDTFDQAQTYKWLKQYT